MPKIEYVIEGEGETILFLHGWGQTKEKMWPLIEELKNKYKCVLLDLPGFGKSKFDTNIKSFKLYVKYIKDFLDEKGIEPQIIVGHSFGGKIAVEYYLMYGKIEKIILLASPILKPFRSFKYYYRVYRYKLLKFLKINKKKYGSRDYQNCKEEMRSLFVNTVNTYYDKTIKKVQIPFLLIWGEKDKEVSIKSAKKLNKKIKNNILYTIKGGHFAYLENIEFTRLVIQNYLKGG